MPQSLIRVPWRVQPTFAVGAKSILGLKALASPLVGEAVTRTPVRAIVSQGIPFSTGGQAGISWDFSAGGLTVIEAPAVPYVPPPFTLLLIARKSTTIAEGLVGFGGASTGSGWIIGSNTANASMRITYGGVADYNITSTGWLLGEIAAYGFVVTASAATAYRNGVSVGTVSVGTPSLPIKPLTFGATYSGGGGYVNYADSEIYNVALLNRAMSAAEVMAATLSLQSQWSYYADQYYVSRFNAPAPSSGKPTLYYAKMQRQGR